MKGEIMEALVFHLGRLFSFDVFFCFFGGRGEGSTRVQINRMSSSGREESRRACSTSSEERLAIVFPLDALSVGVFTGRSLEGVFGLILTNQGVLLRQAPSFGTARFTFTGRLSKCRRQRRGSQGDGFMLSEVDVIVSGCY